VLFGFYDWLRLPMDVILYMLTYCADNDHRDLRYIEKVALDWAEKQIDDLEKALAYVHTFNKDYNVILKIMGQTTGYPTPSQLKYINKWLQEYEMPTELALLACDRAAVNEGRPTFKYVDGIITNWHKKGIHTVADAETDDADFEKKKPDGKARANGKTNRFVNFKQRERDYNQLEKLEREYLTQSLKG
jgi:DnaD/phage-associated family protein